MPEDQYPPKLVGFKPEEYGRERIARKGLERLRWEEERYEPFALSVYDGRTPDVKSINSPVRIPQDRMTAGDLEATCVLTGGDPFGHGPGVKPTVLSVVASVARPDFSRCHRRAPQSFCRMGGQRGESADNTLHREPHLVVAFWKADRGESQQLRQHRTEAHAS